MIYYKVSQFYRDLFGDKVYKIPINVPSICPNIHDGGCIFCGDSRGSFENLSTQMSIEAQYRKNSDYIGRKYKAKQFIPYFQTGTCTSAPLQTFQSQMKQAASQPAVCGLAISTRPDCLSEPYLDVLTHISQMFGIKIFVELGLQSTCNETLKIINRGHTVEDFEQAIFRVKARGFYATVHLIGNLPWDPPNQLLDAAKMIDRLSIDIVKVHSLYVLKNSTLGQMYERGEVLIATSSDYIEKLIEFIRVLPPSVAIERLFGRAPEEQTLFCNWNTSWRKLQMQLEDRMQILGARQGERYERLGEIAATI